MIITGFAAVAVAFAVTFAVLPFLIRALRRHKIRQTEREEGVQSHLKKAGTPTMGGLAILAGILAVTLVFAWKYPAILPVMLLTFGFGAVGFVDDYLKVILHRSDGLLAWQKLLGEIAVTALFLLVLTKARGISLAMLVPFGGGRAASMGWFAVPFAFLVILATVNGVNFTDGLDGLASGVTSVVCLFFLAASALTGSLLHPAAGAVLGSLLAFLCFNSYPAKIFMGDTGSLALGGFVAGMAYSMQMPLYIPIVGFIYALELVSVVLQVLYFKATHGRRIFRMTPIHHHFELCGWSETRIVTVFTVITAVLCMLAACTLGA